MPGESIYKGPERRQAPWVPFDCEKHCPQHGRYDERIASLEKDATEARKERSAMREKSEERHTRVWHEIDKIKEDHEDDMKTLRADHDRRIGDKVPIKHALAAITVILALFGWMMKVNSDANKRVADAQASTGKKIEEKLDTLTTQVITLKVTAEADKRNNSSDTAMVLELRRMTDAMVTAVEKMSNSNKEDREVNRERK